MSNAAATGFGIGLVRSSRQQSPVQTAAASHDPIKYIKSFGEEDENEYHYTDHSAWDCSIATNFGVLQTGLSETRRSDYCGGDTYYDHYITVWEAGIFTRTYDNSTLKSGHNILDQYTKISTSADPCADTGPLLYGNTKGGNRFFSLRGRYGDPCPHEDQTPASEWFRKNHYEDKNYDNYQDVSEWTDEWNSEDSESDMDDFNTEEAAKGMFGGIVGVLTASSTTLGLASLGLGAVSFFEALSEFGQGNGASISSDNQEIKFYHEPIDAGIVANMIEFTARVPKDESYDVTVDMRVGIPEKSECDEEPLRDNVKNNQCIEIHIPSNNPSDDYHSFIFASECN